jgi:hypothetical protein
MRRVLIIATAIAGLVSPLRAQQSETPSPSSRPGPAYPAPGSGRGPAFPKAVSPTDSAEINWFTPQPQYTDPFGANTRWNRWGGRRGWRGDWRW